MFVVNVAAADMRDNSIERFKKDSLSKDDVDTKRQELKRLSRELKARLIAFLWVAFQKQKCLCVRLTYMLLIAGAAVMYGSLILLTLFQDGYNYLEATATKSPDAGLEFDDPRVVSLWAQVKSSNFTDEEANSFKVTTFETSALSFELTHRTVWCP